MCVCVFYYLFRGGPPRHNKVEIGTKIVILLNKHCAVAMNATMRFDVHRSWGYLDNKTGIASGMYGQIHRKEADFSGIFINQVVSASNYR